MKNEDIDFIAENYRDGVFSPEIGWRMLRQRLGIRRKRLGIAAAVAAVIALSASAAVFMHYHYKESRPDTQIPVSLVDDTPMEESLNSKTIVFENSSLTEVVETLESEFDVRIVNLPQNAEEYVLTLRYEGTIEELISAINETLGTRLTLEEE